jgi:hypothetical protein
MLKYGFNHLEFAEIQWPGFWLCLLFYMPWSTQNVKEIELELKDIIWF